MFITVITISINFKAYWIAQKVIKLVIDYEDNFLLEDISVDGSIEAEIQELKEIIFEYFQVNLSIKFGCF